VNRFIFLTGFILFAILTNSIGYGHFSLSAVQESTLTDVHLTDQVHQEDHFDSGKSKAGLYLYETHILLVLLILCLTLASNRNAARHRRLIMLVPVFNQSNYVDQTLLNHQTTI
jgi:hypothetical protein